MRSQVLPANLLQTPAESSLHGATGPARWLLQCRLPMEWKTPTGISAFLESSTSCRQISASSWTPMGCRSTDVSPWSAPGHAGEFLLQYLKHLLPCLLHRPWCTHSCFSPILSLVSLSAVAGLFPLLKCFIPEALSTSLLGSALASSRSILEPASIGSAGHGRGFYQLLREASPVVPCYQNLAMPIQVLLDFFCLSQLKVSHN